MVANLRLYRGETPSSTVGNAAEHFLAGFAEKPGEFPGYQRGQTVFRLEEVYATFLQHLRSQGADPKAWSQNAFARVFRTRFRFVGRRLVTIVPNPHRSKLASFLPRREKLKQGLTRGRRRVSSCFVGTCRPMETRGNPINTGRGEAYAA